ncbi:MAG: class I SAM-dependent methyltransferase [Candidatus Helarchaeota archaeon]
MSNLIDGIGNEELKKLVKNQKKFFHFSELEKNILFSMFGRALVSHDEDYIYKDLFAENIVKKLDVEFELISKLYDETTRIGCVARIKSIETVLREYISKHPNSTIINLGAGLDTTFSKVDNGQIYWYDLDLPDAIEFRKKFISETKRSKTIARSIFDETWTESVEHDATNGVFLFAAGVFHYFTEKQMMELFQWLPARFFGGDLLFDAVTEKGARLINENVRKSKELGSQFDMEMHWHVEKVMDLKKYNDCIEVVEEFPFHSKILSHPDLKEKVLSNPFFNPDKNLIRFIHLKFKKMHD